MQTAPALTAVKTPAASSRGEWLAVIILFLLAGVLGHEPWKQDETYTFGIIYHYYATHTWLVPMNAGVVFLEKPPLYYWTAVIFCKLFAGMLPLYDAARLASVFYMLIASAALFRAGLIFFEGRKSQASMALALFLGTFGVVRHAHDMFTDTALLAGSTIALWGLSLMLCRPGRWLAAGLLFGAGVGIAFLSKGLFIPAVMGLTFILLNAFLPGLRMGRAALALLAAALAACPFILLWPWALYLRTPTMFATWFWDNNIGRFLGFTVSRLGAENSSWYIPTAILWFAFPVLPLACCTLYRSRREWRTPAYILPATFSGTAFLLLTFSASARALYLLPVVPPLAILAAQTWPQLPVRWLIRMTILARALATTGMLLVLILWLGLMHPGLPQPFTGFFSYWLAPGFLPPEPQTYSWFAAAALAGLWLASFRLHGRDPLEVSYVWLAGIALMWGFANTLLLPWINETRSYRAVLADVGRVLDRPPYKDKCVARYRLGESVSPLWEYFGAGRGMGPEEGFEGVSCPLLFTMTGKATSITGSAGWHLIWKGSRPMDDKDELQLYGRDGAVP